MSNPKHDYYSRALAELEAACKSTSYGHLTEAASHRENARMFIELAQHPEAAKIAE